MYVNAELHTALGAIRRDEIRREITRARLVRQAGKALATVRAPRGPWAPLVRLRAMVAQALVPGAAAPPAA